MLMRIAYVLLATLTVSAVTLLGSRGDTALATERDPLAIHLRGLSFDPTGQYYIAEHDFAVRDSFTYFELWVRRRGGKLRYFGRVRSVEGQFFRITSLSVVSEKVAFRTDVLQGSRFEFEGHFTRRGVFWIETPEGGPVLLKGRLTRTRRGTTLYSYSTGFRFYAGC